MNNINHFISNDFKALQSTDRLEEVQLFFEESNFVHFPVLESGVFVGNIFSEELEALDQNKTIHDFKYTLEPFFVRKNMQWLSIMEVFAKNNTNIVPVLDDSNQYIGYYELEDIVKYIYDTPFIQEHGTHLVIEKSSNDFSMGQVSQIVENSNGKLLGLFISNANPSIIQATLKIGMGNVNEIIQSFRRYEYDVVSTHDEDEYWNNLKERSAYLDKYLNI